MRFEILIPKEEDAVMWVIVALSFFAGFFFGVVWGKE